MVDIAQVRDIRRALRRKYASRSNLPRIFAQWDIGNKGGISVEDLLNGLQKVGIRMNHEEAATLHASAKQDSEKNLSAQEFQTLLFSGDETFNVNLRQIPAPTDDDKLAAT